MQSENKNLKETIKQISLATVRNYMQSGAFTDRKITDTPTESFSLVNRKYVNLNGTTALRPTSPSVGQFYFDTTLGFPVWWDGSDWVDATGSPA